MGYDLCFASGNHSEGHNRLIQKMKGEYYFCLSNDMLYDSSFLTNILQGFEKYPTFRVATGKSLVWNFSEQKKTKNIDSCGLSLFRGFRCTDRGQGELDAGQYEKEEEIFGASGAFAIFHKKVLDKICVQNEFFDENLHYKNDVDLAFRLQFAGERCLFLPKALAWHDRQWSAKSGRKNQSRKQRISSLRGYLFLLKKNIWGRGFSLKAQSFLFFHLLGIFFYTLFREPFLLPLFFSRKGGGNFLQKKRAIVVSSASSQKIESFFSGAKKI